ncbi:MULTISPECIES: hypothetical protein [Parabacteroides]|uniref:Uncharacterized protein n=1 Tax=Parabacteroides goldsteinii TaxID=328812 RepID=A0A6G1ZLZ2_9BACT|nr:MULTISPECIES: hypothetical protein [Parabacteroides]MBF0768042.1 hypothetical protein [Parabacteroides goldsteinii]MRX95372.1 hypothetical protein [Parabacteroides goldsteinii]MRY00529.1 hypothetical protein [Parabacteroides goldsteinii]MRY05672.1 hypothetical protein [Parabacteroides goldsteinii]MRY14949.1 hypothetical protein [Parabacteroides goldsteinii]
MSKIVQAEACLLFVARWRQIQNSDMGYSRKPVALRSRSLSLGGIFFEVIVL